MHAPLNRVAKLLISLAACILTSVLFSAVAYADTDGTELQVAEQADQLIIQLGPAWAGVEFTLKTDAGLYPQPIVVSDEGLLTMDLGGSQNYILSALHSATPIPSPAPVLNEAPDGLAATSEFTEAQNSMDDDAPAPPLPMDNDLEQEKGSIVEGIPNMHLFLFFGGLIACVIGMILMWVLKRRRNNSYDDADYEAYDA